MIIALVEETCALIREVETRQKAKNELESVNETFRALTALNESITQLQNMLQLLHTRLSLAEINTITDIGMRCMWQLNQSAEQFLHQSRQKNQIQVIQTQFQKALDSLKKTWEIYVDRHTCDSLELYRLVAKLPGVSERKAAYDDVQNRLALAKKTLPTTQKHLDDFDRTVAQFKQMLQETGNLREEVKVFLGRIANGTASLADLTDEVLQWCRQDQRGKTFSIRIV